MNTRGFGGRKLKKSITVLTNDQNQKKLALRVSGEVEKFVTINPSRIRLTGPVGTPIMTSVSIVPEKKHMFKILNVEAKKGEFIDVELKDTGEGKDRSYMLIVTNKKVDTGRYFDLLKLKTDSEIQPEIPIRIHGHIFDRNLKSARKKKLGNKPNQPPDNKPQTNKN